jgi:hypothetical protein
MLHDSVAVRLVKSLGDEVSFVSHLRSDFKPLGSQE